MIRGVVCLVKRDKKGGEQIVAERTASFVTARSHNHRLSRWLAQPYKGMVLAGLKAHRNFCHLQICPTNRICGVSKILFARLYKCPIGH